MALKINKDHVIYMIPAYKSNNERDNNLYSISINSNGNTIDTKLTITEVNNDGTQTNSTRNFNFSISTSKKQSYAEYIEMELKCDCVASISDCTCHTSHASGGCDHPDISVNCTNCTGGSGININNPSNNSNNGPTSSSNNQIGAIFTSSSGSNYGYTYNLSGNEIFMSLMKKYRPDYVFSALQKYNIINTPEITNPLLQFLDTDGSSPMNKDFALSIIDAIEEGTVTTYKEFNVLLNAYKRTVFLINNNDIAVQLNTFLNQNNTVEAKVFADKLISEMMLNSSLKFDISASFKSPTNIDRSSIPYNLAKPENQKFNEIYDALTTSPEFKKLFIDIFNDSSRFNVKFQIGAISGGANGNTNTDLLNPKLNLITISTQFLLTHNKMEIAKTILHECLHAFLNVKLCDTSIGISIPNVNNMEVYNCINEYYNGFNNDQNQHDFIYNFMVPNMVTVLSEVKDLLVTPAESNFLETEISLHPTSPTLDIPWNWNDFYLNLSLGGLQNCKFFQIEIGAFTIINGVPTPTTIIDPIKMNNYNQYNQHAANYLHH